MKARWQILLCISCKTIFCKCRGVTRLSRMRGWRGGAQKFQRGFNESDGSPLIPVQSDNLFCTKWQLIWGLKGAGPLTGPLPRLCTNACASSDSEKREIILNHSLIMKYWAIPEINGAPLTNQGTKCKCSRHSVCI